MLLYYPSFNGMLKYLLNINSPPAAWLNLSDCNLFSPPPPPPPAAPAPACCKGSVSACLESAVNLVLSFLARHWRREVSRDVEGQNISKKYHLQQELFVSAAQQALHVHQALLHPLIRREDQVVVQLRVRLHP